MPGKKSDKKGGKGANSAVALDADGRPNTSSGPTMEQLNKETEKLMMRLREYEELIDKKNLDLDLKDKQLDSMQQGIDEERARHTEEIKLAIKERDMEREDLAYLRLTMENKIKRLQTDLSAYSEMEQQNQIMTNRVAELMNQMDAQNARHTEFTNRIKSDSFNVRLLLEQKYRKELEEMDARYKEEAFQDINRESKRALLDNSRLEEELALQSVGINKLLKKHKEAENTIKKLRVEKQLLQEKVRLQMQTITKLKRNCRDSEARLASSKAEALSMSSSSLFQQGSGSFPRGVNNNNNHTRNSVGHKDLSRRSTRETTRTIGGGINTIDNSSELHNALKDRARYKSLHERAQNRAKTWKSRALVLSDRLVRLQASQRQKLETTSGGGMRTGGVGAEGSSMIEDPDGDGNRAITVLAGEEEGKGTQQAEDMTSMWSSKHDPSDLFGAYSSHRHPRAGGSGAKTLAISASLPSMTAKNISSESRKDGTCSRRGSKSKMVTRKAAKKHFF